MMEVPPKKKSARGFNLLFQNFSLYSFRYITPTKVSLLRNCWKFSLFGYISCSLGSVDCFENLISFNLEIYKSVGFCFKIMILTWIIILRITRPDRVGIVRNFYHTYIFLNSLSSLSRNNLGSWLYSNGNN